MIEIALSRKGSNDNTPVVRVTSTVDTYEIGHVDTQDCIPLTEDVSVRKGEDEPYILTFEPDL